MLSLSIQNIGLVLSWEGEDEMDVENKPYFRSSPLVPLVKKMSEDLRSLEEEYGYLSSQINLDNEPNNRKYPLIEDLCKHIYDDLKQYGEGS